MNTMGKSQFLMLQSNAQKAPFDLWLGAWRWRGRHPSILPLLFEECASHRITQVPQSTLMDGRTFSKLAE